MQQNRLQQQQALQITITALKRQIVEQEKNLANAQAQVEKTQAILDRIAASQDALIFKDDVEALKDKSHAIRQGKSALDDFQDELKQLKDQLGDKTAPDGLAQLSFTEQQQKLENLRTQVDQCSLNSQSETAHWQSLVAQTAEKQSVLATVNTWLEEHAADAVLLTGFLDELGRLKKLRDRGG